MIELIEDLTPAPMTTFEMVRQRDESGLSLSTADNPNGIVLEGVVYTDGTVSLHWRSRYWSVVFYPDWKTFVNVHIGSHPTNGTILRFYPRVGEPWDWKQQDDQQEMQTDAAALVNAVKQELCP